MSYTGFFCSYLQAEDMFNEISNLNLEPTFDGNDLLQRMLITLKLGQSAVDQLITLHGFVPHQWPNSLRNELILANFKQSENGISVTNTHIDWIQKCFHPAENVDSSKLMYIGPPIGMSNLSASVVNSVNAHKTII